jgi:WXXGXW repeat (2 copies)
MRKAKLIFGAMLFVLAMLAAAEPSRAQVAVGVSVRVGPPALPVYEQPVCPGPGYLWTPGYWAYGDEGYYWVPGTWVMAPEVGLLWTPGYWGWGGGVYVWHPGYWGRHVGFYGGINYGFGYTGVGFVGGEWRGRDYHYNTAVTRVNTTVIHNTYRTTVINNTTINRVSYNGGKGGVMMRPNARELDAGREHHFEATHLQREHERAARGNHEFRASENHGRPAVGASARPGEFHGRDEASSRRGPAEGRAERPNDRGGDHGRADRRESHGDGGAPNARGNQGNGNSERGNGGGRGNAGHGAPNNSRGPEGRGKPSH